MADSLARGNNARESASQLGKPGLPGQS